MLGLIIGTSHFFCDPLRLCLFLRSPRLKCIPSCFEVAWSCCVRALFCSQLQTALRWSTLAAFRTAKDRPDGKAAPHAQ